MTEGVIIAEQTYTANIEVQNLPDIQHKAFNSFSYRYLNASTIEIILFAEDSRDDARVTLFSASASRDEGGYKICGFLQGEPGKIVKIKMVNITSI
jgi:hypothetical protein